MEPLDYGFCTYNVSKRRPLRAGHERRKLVNAAFEGWQQPIESAAGLMHCKPWRRVGAIKAACQQVDCPRIVDGCPCRVVAVAHVGHVVVTRRIGVRAPKDAEKLGRANCGHALVIAQWSVHAVWAPGSNPCVIPQTAAASGEVSPKPDVPDAQTTFTWTAKTDMHPPPFTVEPAIWTASNLSATIRPLAARRRKSKDEKEP
ncbi:hypothetical protein GCM10009552_29040 [Rothia nasimurium]